MGNYTGSGCLTNSLTQITLILGLLALSVIIIGFNFKLISISGLQQDTPHQSR